MQAQLMHTFPVSVGKLGWRPKATSWAPEMKREALSSQSSAVRQPSSSAQLCPYGQECSSRKGGLFLGLGQEGAAQNVQMATELKADLVTHH